MPQLPKDETQDVAGQPRIGVDDWVSSKEGRTEGHAGALAPLREGLDRISGSARLAIVVALAAIFPLLTESDYLVRVGVNTLLFALLALGLNVVVGYAGLLDLGYIAFYGFGAYVYAVLSSSHFDVHLPTIVSVPVVVLASALLGLLLGLPSRRLVGDYLAIVSLFFAQIFVTLLVNSNRITPPWSDQAVDFTGGPNGIAELDSLGLFGWQADSITSLFYVALVVFTVVVVGLHFISESRTGRAWRALREDPLAAEVMSMPINRLKLLAFAFGAGVAGLTGAVFAAVQEGVFPNNFSVTLLITIYAMVILGGVGSLTGVIIGAILITVLPEVLENPDQARLLFYGLVVLTLLARLRPWRRLAAVLTGTVAFGLVVHAVVGAVWSRGTAGAILEPTALTRWIDDFVLLPSSPRTIGNVAFVVLVAAVLGLTLLRGRLRLTALVPVLYLAAFVWENRLVDEPSITRILLLGALLVVLMNARPQGLLGTSRVEIV